jgi:hypothetical protein
MKTGLSLQQLAAELERQIETRKDYIAPQGKVDAIVDDGEVKIDGVNGKPMALTPFAHNQLTDHLGIPRKYYQRMQAEQPELLASNIRTWLHADPDNRRMLRALDGKIRGVLTPKFRPLDNFDLAQAVFPKLIEMQAQIMSCELTETRMYIKAILPQLSDELTDGLAFGVGHNNVGTDRGKLVSAIVISNSEVGNGTLRVEPSVFTTWCTNLAILQQAAMKKYHVGRAHEADSSWEVFRDATREADDKAFWLKVQDVTAAAFDEKLFRAAIAQIRIAGGHAIKSDNLPAVVESAVEVLALPEHTSNGVLKFLASGGDLTQWGLSSAFTRMAGEAPDYELATQLERAGGTIISLDASQWERVSTAA